MDLLENDREMQTSSFKKQIWIDMCLKIHYTLFFNFFHRHLKG